MVNEIAGECEKLSKAVSPSASYEEPTTPYIPPMAQETTPYIPPSAPEVTESAPSVPAYEPTPAPAIPYNPPAEAEPASVSIMGIPITVSDTAPVDQFPAPAQVE